MTEEQVQYYSKLDYPYLLLTQISKILNAIDFKQPARSEVEGLLSILIPRWKKRFEKELEEKKEYRDKMLDELSKIKGEIGSATYKSRILYIEQEYALWVVQKVIDILDQNKLLLIEQRPILEGGYE